MNETEQRPASRERPSTGRAQRSVLLEILAFCIALGEPDVIDRLGIVPAEGLDKPADTPCPECHGTGLVDDNEHYDRLWGPVMTDPFYAYQGKRYCRACGGGQG